MDLAPDDMIVAPATPPGRGALGLVRVSGSGALELAARLAGRTSFAERRATRARLRLREGWLEDGVVTTFVAPRSFTGQDSVEFTVHGSPVIIDSLVGACIEAGARLAGPGEFSHRAFLNGKLDLLQAEAVADLASATTPGQARLASWHLEGTLSREIVQIGDRLASVRALLEASLDFPDEGYHFIEPDDLVKRLGSIRSACDRLLATADTGQRLHDGALVVIAGPPNAGKSSLFNALVGRPRAIVTPVAGTTRDLLVETIDIGGVPVRLVDTAGLRTSDDPVEVEGVARAVDTVSSADLVIFLVDGTTAEEGTEAARQEWERLPGSAPRLLALSKSDVWQQSRRIPAWCPPETIGTSSVVDGGLDDLVRAIASHLAAMPIEGTMLTRARHRMLVGACGEAVARAAVMAGEGSSEEYVLADIHEALSALASLRGVETPDEVLQTIFSTFCIGK